MNNSITLNPTEKKDHYRLNINGLDMGEWERSDLNHLVQTIDNAI